MRRLGLSIAIAWALLSVAAAQTPAPARPDQRASAALAPPATFEKYCFECHGESRTEADLSIEQLVKTATPVSVGERYADWERIIEMLDSELMPPSEASIFPEAAERAAALTWIRGALRNYEEKYAGAPGRVTVRRLTSAEYRYAIHDLTGLDLDVGIDASSDAVGGEGFANFGDVQFVEAAIVERYLAAARQVADHALIGAGPLAFYVDPGKTGLELSALNRINELYAAKGFRVVSGEGGRPFGLERYGQAFYVAWAYQHRKALGKPDATLRSLAAEEGITGRFAEHIWSVVNAPSPRYPTRETVEAWKRLPAPGADRAASIAAARAGCDEIFKALTTWPSWFFARGDLAAGGAGDESPLLFDDNTLRASATHRFSYPLGGGRGGRGRGAAPGPAAPTTVYLTFASVNPEPGVTPVVIWRNARVVTRSAPAAGRRGGGGAAAAAAGGGRGRGRGGDIVSTQPLREVLPADVSARLTFGTSPDGTAIGPDDFATTATVSFTIDPPAPGLSAELQAEVELGRDRNAVVRLAISDRPEGSPRDAGQRVLLGDQTTAGYRAFRAGMAEYVSLLPPNSHGEANPADKDPVPAPFDNTYNSPEHDAFINNVKYQRNDTFFTDNMVDGADRDRLNHAWNDLFGSWPYHDAYLGMLIEHYNLTLPTRRIAELDEKTIRALPAEPRGYIEALRAHYDDVLKAHTAAEPGHVKDALAFASRAWRRPLTRAEEDDLRAFYRKVRDAHQLDHDAALRALLARILVSPAFLYRLETAPRGPEGPLDSYELASRLSFFLWSSIPDDELRRAAEAGELAEPARLKAQVTRMLADPKARRFATEFFGQWLGFYHFDEYRGVDTSRFPEFTADVRAAMYNEAISTFEYIVRQGRPVREILTADYTFLNAPLAAFYGIDRDIESTDDLQRVEEVRTLNRGGALRLGAVLTATSAPLRTSPVKRGDWVLRRLLGTPTPPPPADAGSIEGDPTAFQGLTVRERLQKHKRNATCANCHLRIDPLGFPLEEFDAVGRPRRTYDNGQPVDVTGEFADTTTISGAEGLIGYLGEHESQILNTLSRKMLGYALGRTVLASDRPLVAGMVAAGGGASFADLAAMVVTSRQFRHRAGEDPAPADNPPGLKAGLR